MNFTVDCVRGHKDGVLLLITADAGGQGYGSLNRQQSTQHTLNQLSRAICSACILGHCYTLAYHKSLSYSSIYTRMVLAVCMLMHLRL